LVGGGAPSDLSRPARRPKKIGGVKIKSAAKAFGGGGF